MRYLKLMVPAPACYRQALDLNGISGHRLPALWPLRLPKWLDGPLGGQCADDASQLWAFEGFRKLLLLSVEDLRVITKKTMPSSQRQCGNGYYA